MDARPYNIFFASSGRLRAYQQFGKEVRVASATRVRDVLM